MRRTAFTMTTLWRRATCGSPRPRSSPSLAQAGLPKLEVCKCLQTTSGRYPQGSEKTPGNSGSAGTAKIGSHLEFYSNRSLDPLSGSQNYSGDLKMCAYPTNFIFGPYLLYGNFFLPICDACQHFDTEIFDDFGFMYLQQDDTNILLLSWNLNIARRYIHKLARTDLIQFATVGIRGLQVDQNGYQG